MSVCELWVGSTTHLSNDRTFTAHQNWSDRPRSQNTVELCDQELENILNELITLTLVLRRKTFEMRPSRKCKTLADANLFGFGGVV